MTTQTAVGVFDSRLRASEAIDALRTAGFTADQIGMVTREDRLHEARSGLKSDPTHTRWEEGAGIGAAAGAVSGVGLGLAVAAGLIPGIGPAIAGGTLVALLASAGTGATVGTVLGSLVGLGIPEDDATYYESEVVSGRTVVTVEAGNRWVEATNILYENGAIERTSPVAYGAF